jgi:hypothetical protein
VANEIQADLVVLGAKGLRATLGICWEGGAASADITRPVLAGSSACCW